MADIRYFPGQNLSQPLAGGGDGPHDPGMEARVAKLEAAVEHIQTDVREIRGILACLAPVIDRIDGFLQASLPRLATKDEIGAEASTLRVEIERWPTRRQSLIDIAMIAGLIGVILTIGSHLTH